MTLPLPFQVKDSDTQANFDDIAQQFPIRALNTANDVVGLTTPSTNHTRLSWGAINANGTVAAGSADFTCAKTATGRYKVTWSTAKAGSNYATVVAVDNNAGFQSMEINWANRLAASFDVATGNSSWAALVDTSWCFVVIDAQ